MLDYFVTEVLPLTMPGDSLFEEPLWMIAASSIDASYALEEGVWFSFALILAYLVRLKGLGMVGLEMDFLPSTEVTFPLTFCEIVLFASSLSLLAPAKILRLLPANANSFVRVVSRTGIAFRFGCFVAPPTLCTFEKYFSASFFCMAFCSRFFLTSRSSISTLESYGFFFWFEADFPLMEEVIDNLIRFLAGSAEEPDNDFFDFSSSSSRKRGTKSDIFSSCFVSSVCCGKKDTSRAAVSLFRTSAIVF
jgi:hypothetical protein